MFRKTAPLERRAMTCDELQRPYDECWYAISGVGGSVWGTLVRYEKIMRKNDMGRPQSWFWTTGATLIVYADAPLSRIHVDPRSNLLIFPTSGMDPEKLLQMRQVARTDWWFPHLVDALRKSHDEVLSHGAG